MESAQRLSAQRSMHVLHVIDSGGLFGAEVMLLTLAEEQKRMGINPIIASIGERGVVDKPLESEARKRKLLVQTFRMRSGPNLIGALKLLKFARRHQIDLLHTHGYKGNILFGLLPHYVCRPPVVSTVHGYTSTTFFSRLRLYEWLDVAARTRLEAVVFVHSGMPSNRRYSIGQRKNVYVIPNGITLGTDQNSDIGIFTPNENDFIVQFCKKGFTIGSIGRLSSEKGYADLIKAIRILRDQKIDARFVVIGDGEERSHLEDLIRSQCLNGTVLLAGFQSAAYRYLPFFSVYANSSLTEGLPITVLEAMAAEIPIVATAVGGIPEVLAYGKAGLLVPSGDPVAMAEALKKMVSQTTRRLSLIQAAKQIVIQYYSSHRMARDYVAIYKHLKTLYPTRT